MLDRRNFLKLALAAQAFAAFPANAAAPGLRFGEPQPFSGDWLKAHAQALAAASYSPPPHPDPQIVASIDYDAHGKLKYKNDFALFGDGHESAFPITFMHVGQYFPKTVRMYAVEPSPDGGSAREILYDPDYFAIPSDSVAAKLPANPSRFAGFWLREPKAGTEDWRVAEPWVTFLGASYFRAKGELGQVGLSARGIALTPGGNMPEEFPDFVAFWFLPAPPSARAVTVYALLDGPSVTGAYRFNMERTKGVVMDIEKTLFFRQPVERLGLAPLTSMFWYSETVKQAAIDWRPEVHDSDGLALWTGGGEHIWRPSIIRPTSPFPALPMSIRAASVFYSETANSTITSMGCATTGARRLGSSRSGTGEKEPCNSLRCRPTTRSTITLSLTGIPRSSRRRAIASICAIACIGLRMNPTRRRLLAASRPVLAGAGSRASRARLACENSSWSFWAGR